MSLFCRERKRESFVCFVYIWAREPRRSKKLKLKKWETGDKIVNWVGKLFFSEVVSNGWDWFVGMDGGRRIEAEEK